MISKSLISKLTLAFLLVAVTAAALVSISIRLTSNDRLFRLIVEQQRSELQTLLSDYYSTNGSWDGVVDYWQTMHFRLPFDPQPQNNQLQALSGQPPEGDRHGMFGLVDQNGVVIIALRPDYSLGMNVSQEVISSGAPIEVNGVRAGTILTTSFQPQLSPQETLYLARTNQALLYAVLGAVLVALVMSILLARTLSRPLQALTKAAQNIAEGDLEQQVKVGSKDEIGQLAQAFNQMSQEVARGNRLRRQMTADIAHDLRTPLTVIAGYIESMRDGILQPTSERLKLIYDEIERLQHLVGDLRMLTQAETGELSMNPQPISPRYLLERATAPYMDKCEQQDIQIHVEADANLPEICVDEDRMMQIFGNLLSNSLRYTPADGEITLSAFEHDQVLTFTIKDTGTGIDPESLPHIFDRFYRADPSRTTDGGEAGLGLAITKALVEAQKGTIHAESIPGKGTAILIEIPIKQ